MYNTLDYQKLIIYWSGYVCKDSKHHFVNK